jgi:hypothetical protein
LHAAFEIVQQLAVQSHPVPLNLLLLRKSFPTLDGITRQLDPISMPGWNPRVCLWGVRKRSRRRANLEHSIPVARPARFLSFWAAHANARGSFRGHDPKVVQTQKPVDTKKQPRQHRKPLTRSFTRRCAASRAGSDRKFAEHPASQRSQRPEHER